MLICSEPLLPQQGMISDWVPMKPHLLLSLFFLGTVLNEVLHDIQERVEKSKKFTEAFKSELKIDIHNKIPNLFKDNTDRNRTSPFAFTGNKFEFRAVGSSANCAEPMIVLNAIVARQLKQFKKNVDAFIKEGYKKDGAILKELSNCIKDSWPIVFGGDVIVMNGLKRLKKEVCQI